MREGKGYTAAPQGPAEGPGKGLDKGPGKGLGPGRRQRCALGCCGAGLAVLLTSLIAGFLLKPYVTSRIAGAMVLAEGEPAFLAWMTPPVSPVRKVFFFNLTNSAALLAGLERPRLEKVGPYTYTQLIAKVNHVFDASGELVTFSDNKTYFFDSSLSNGTESDVIVMPNIPLFGAFRKLEHSPWVVQRGFETVLKSQDGLDKVPFLELSVGEFLWGYPSIVMTMADTWGEGAPALQEEEGTTDEGAEDEEGMWTFGSDWEDWEGEERKEDVERKRREARAMDSGQKKFGFFIGTNMSSVGRRTVHTGLGDLVRKGLVERVGGEALRGSWPGDGCNDIEGRDAGTLTIGLAKREDLLIYFPDMCRSIRFRYQRTVRYSGIDSLRFSPREETFHRPEYEPANSCYSDCTSPRCLPSGVVDLGVGCPFPEPGNPVYMSWPHFLHGDPSLRAAVDGMEPPSKDLHAFFIDIQPDWGITLAARAAFQFNVRLVRNGFSWMKDVSEEEVILPFLMLEEGVEEPNELVVEQVVFVTGLPDRVKGLALVLGAAAALLLMAPELWLWGRACCTGHKAPIAPL